MPLIKAAIEHQGAAFIDVISPCVAFNNHAGSTKSYDYVREHNEAVNRLDFMLPRDEITADYAPGTVQRGHAARRLGAAPAQARRRLRPDDRITAMNYLAAAPGAAAKSLPGCCTSIREPEDLHAHLNTVDAPLNQLGERELCPGSAALEKFNASLR